MPIHTLDAWAMITKASSHGPPVLVWSLMSASPTPGCRDPLLSAEEIWLRANAFHIRYQSLSTPKIPGFIQVCVT